jgi:hypothetical protein
LVGSVFRPLGVGIHISGWCHGRRGQQRFQPFARRTLPSLQAAYPKRHLLELLNTPQRENELTCVAGEIAPFPAAEAVFGHGLEDLGNAVAGDRRAAAKPSSLRADGFGFGRQA